MTYDIAIIGAGPAGATLARKLHPNYSVLLLDRRDLSVPQPSERGKCCGGLLAPDAQKMIGKMGLAIPKSILVDPQLFLVRTVDIDNHIERYYQRFYFNMDRKKFDAWLVSLIPDSVDLAFGCKFTGFLEDKDGVTFSLVHDGHVHTVKARILVGADGALSKVRNQAFPDSPVKRYVAIQEWYPAINAVPHYGVLFDQEVTDFYGWTITKDDQLLVGVALKEGADIHRKFDLFKEKLQQSGYVLETPIRREGSWLCRPGSTKEIVTGNDKVLLIGEAAGFISPSSGEGISYAMESASILAESMESGFYGIGQRYAKKTKKLKRNIAMKNMKKAFMYTPFLRKLVMKSSVLATKLEPEWNDMA